MILFMFPLLFFFIIKSTFFIFEYIISINSCTQLSTYFYNIIHLKHNFIFLVYFKSKLKVRFKSRSVAQGTVLSPLLCIIYVMELSNLKIEGSLYSHADDTALIVTGDTWQSVTKLAENSLSKIIEWFSNKNVSLNYNKTVCVTFSNSIKTSPNISNIKVHDPTCTSTPECSCRIINRTNKTKYLGVTFDQHLR